MHLCHGGGRQPLTLCHRPSATDPQPLTLTLTVALTSTLTAPRRHLHLFLRHLHLPPSPPLLDQVEGLGHFRKYANGRLIGRFADRTVATLLPPALASASVVTAATGAVAGMGEAGGGERGRHSFGWYLCHLVFPDGRTTQVRSDCPVGAEPHVSRY